MCGMGGVIRQNNIFDILFDNKQLLTWVITYSMTQRYGWYRFDDGLLNYDVIKNLVDKKDDNDP